ncbi:MAG: hypothetical protein HQL17_06835 [Candidatus Omnitrophica bacterium]|nr:hypothetical protein [Candidatus Omnitrophota bacterium]
MFKHKYYILFLTFFMALMTCAQASYWPISGGGNIGIGTSVPKALLQVGAGNPTLSADLSSKSTFIKGNLEVDGNIYGNGAGLTGIPGTVTGLTARYVPVATAANALGNSNIYQNAGGNIGIGSAVPGAFLDILGTDMRVSNAAANITMNRTDATGTAALDFQTTASWNWALGTLTAGSDKYTFRSNVYGDTLVMTTAGNVGVATVSPLAQLEVRQQGTVPPFMVSSVSGLNGDFLTVTSTGRIGIQTAAPVSTVQIGSFNPQNSASLYINTGGSASTYQQILTGSAVGLNFAVTNAGNVGIGTIDPQSKLQVGVNPTLPVGSLPALSVKGNVVVDGMIYGNGSSLTGIAGLISGLTANYIPKATSATAVANSSMYQDGSGNIGIGTAIPRAVLDVYGANGIRLNSGATYTSTLTADNGGLRIGSSQTATTSMRLLPYSNDIYIQNVNPAGNIMFSGNAGASLTGNMLLVVSGNVGVNSTTPAAKLDVVGSGTGIGRLMTLRDSNQTIKFTVLDNGNVGIGTSNPGYLFEVGSAGTSRFNAPVYMVSPGLTYWDSTHNNLTVATSGFGPGSTAIYAERAGGVNAGDGGANWLPDQVDAGLSASSAWGNTFSAGVAAWNYLDFDNSAALVAGSNTKYYALLAYNSNGTTHGGIFMNGNVGVGLVNPQAMLEVEQILGVPYFMASSGPAADGDYFIIDSTGNVGVGTPLPQSRLEVQKAGTSSLLMLSSSASVDGDYLSVTSIGNVGIGTWLPVAPLDVTTYSASVRLGNTTDSAQATLFIKNSTGSAGWKIIGYGATNAGGANRLGFLYNDLPQVTFMPNGNVGFGTTVPMATFEVQTRATVPPLMVSSSAATDGDYFIVASTGNVGIGTVAPAYKFQAVTTLNDATADEAAFALDYTTNKATSGNDTGLRINMTDTSSPGVSRLIDTQVYGISQFSILNNNVAYFARNVGIGTTEPGGHLEIQRTLGVTPFMISSSGSTDGDLLILTSSGNMGIGTTAPGLKLSVNGSAIFQGNSTGGTEGEFVYDTGVHYYKYFDGTQWQQLAGGSINYSGSLWNQNGANVYYTTGFVGINTTSPDNLLSIWQMMDSDAIKIYGYSSKSTSYFQTHITSTGDTRLRTSGNLFLDIAGNVGIRTGTPAALLNLTGGSVLLDNNRSIQFKNTNGTIKDVILFDNTNNLALDSGTSGGALIFSTAAVERARINASGNVGIGTSTPNATLEIQTGVVPPFMVSSGPTTDGNYLMVTSAGRIGLGTTAPAGRLDVTGAGTTTGFSMIVRDSTLLARLAVLDNGNIGIGTTTPAKKLVVYSADSQQMRLGANETAYWDITRSPVGTLEFYSIDPSPSIKFALMNTGNVGVGTALPDRALSVKTMGQNAVVNVYGVTSGTDYGVIQVSNGGSVSNAPGHPLVLQPNAGNVGIGTTATVARFQVGANPAVMAGSNPVVGIKGNVDIDGDIYLSNSASKGITGNTELVLRQDGDALGTSILRLRNRTAEGGLILETTAVATPVTDLVFKTASSQRNIRYENRGASARTGNPSFHIGGVSPDSPTLSVGDSYVAVSNNLSIGTYAVPGRALAVKGSGSFTGNVGIGTTATTYLLQVGNIPATVTSGANPVATVKGNFVVDGKIYGDGSNLTSIPGLISGLTASYIPKAASAASLNNSNLYQDGSGNIGIGTTIPTALLNVRGNLKVTGQMLLGAYALTDAATIAVDWNNGNLQYVTLGANRQITFSNPVAGAKYTLVLIQDVTGSRTITSWPAVLWSGGVAPTLTTTTVKADIISCLYVNSQYYCDVSQNF